MLLFERVSFGYYPKQIIFKNLAWEVMSPIDTGENLHFILSPSGYGKSTLFKLILNTEQPSSGRISVLSQKSISYVPQEPVMFEHLSIYENATFFSKIKARKIDFDQEIFEYYAKSLDLESLLESKKTISELSGGQKRRLSLLKALSLNPNILLLDEPTSGLDAKVKLDFLNSLASIARNNNILVLYITHHFDEARYLADRIHFLSKSPYGYIDRIIDMKPNDFVLTPPSLDAAYMVDFPHDYILRASIVENKIYEDSKGMFFVRIKGEINLKNFRGKAQIYDKNGSFMRSISLKNQLINE